MSPLSRTRGVREKSATRDSHRVAEADGSLMFPEVLRPAPSECIRARLMIPDVGKVLEGAPLGKDFFDCSWSLLNHGVAQRMRLNLGNLNPIYERELIKLGVYQKVEGS